MNKSLRSVLVSPMMWRMWVPSSWRNGAMRSVPSLSFTTKVKRALSHAALDPTVNSSDPMLSIGFIVMRPTCREPTRTLPNGALMTSAFVELGHRNACVLLQRDCLVDMILPIARIAAGDEEEYR